MSVTKARREEEAALSPWDDGPCGFDAGDANLRRIVGNDPTNATDPTGLNAMAIGGQATVVYVGGLTISLNLVFDESGQTALVFSLDAKGGAELSAGGTLTSAPLADTKEYVEAAPSGIGANLRSGPVGGGAFIDPTDPWVAGLQGSVGPGIGGSLGKNIVTIPILRTKWNVEVEKAKAAAAAAAQRVLDEEFDKQVAAENEVKSRASEALIRAGSEALKKQAADKAAQATKAIQQPLEDMRARYAKEITEIKRETAEAEKATELIAAETQEFQRRVAITQNLPERDIGETAAKGVLLQKLLDEFKQHPEHFLNKNGP